MDLPEALIAVGGRPLPISAMAPGSPQAVALETFQRIASAEEYGQLVALGGVYIRGKYADYVLVANGSSLVMRGNDVVARGCLVLEAGVDDVVLHELSFPPLDHFIANYLVLKSRERYYWETACLTGVRTVEIAELSARIRAEVERVERERVRTWRERFGALVGIV